jgi:alginate O-acetyltransferase complex protein AlgJ
VSDRKRTTKPLLLVAFLMFFGPALAGLAGVRPNTDENRTPRPFPSLSDGWEFLPNLDGWAIDHLPGRGKAVGAQEKVSEGLFGELSANSPGAQALTKGRDGWLYLREDTRLECAATAATIDTALAGLSRFGRLLAARGKRFVFVVVPDKTAVERGHLPARYPLKHCADEGDQRFWDRMRTDPGPGYLDLHEPVLALCRRAGQAYYATDTHWLPAAAAQFGLLLAGRLDPAVADATRLRGAGTQPMVTDLPPMLGRQVTERVPWWVPDRAGVTTTARDISALGSSPVQHVTNATTAAPLVAGRTLLIGDSFLDYSAAQVEPYFADVRRTQWQGLVADPPGAVGLLRSSDTVVVELVERNLAGGAVALLVPAFLDRLDQDLGPPAG